MLSSSFANWRKGRLSESPQAIIDLAGGRVSEKHGPAELGRNSFEAHPWRAARLLCLPSEHEERE